MPYENKLRRAILGNRSGVGVFASRPAPRFLAAAPVPSPWPLSLLPHPWLFLLIVFGFLVLLGATSGLVNERLWVSEPLACVLLGIALGPVGANLLRIDPLADPLSTAVLREAARVTLAIAVAGAALRLPQHWLSRNWRGLAVALGPGMLLTLAASALLAAVALGLSLPAAVLIGAAVASTDPVLSASVLTGRLARSAVPAPLRHGLTAESGINDGLAYPLVMLAVLLIQHGWIAAGSLWLVKVLLWEVGGAVVVGIAVGWGTSRCLLWARRRPDSEATSLLTVSLALALATLAGVRVLGGDGVLAAFVAGAMLNRGNPNRETQAQHEHFNEALSRFFDLPIMVVFGAAIPWTDWFGLGWGGLAFALGIVFLRRLPAWLLIGRFVPWAGGRRGELFAGWFGPVGAAALLYAMLVFDDTGLRAVWPAISLAVGASILVHGITGTPLTWFSGRALSERFASAYHAPDQDPLAPQKTE